MSALIVTGDIVTLDPDRPRVEALAIGFLNSYVNPVHERRAKEIVQQECPGVFVTCSHEVSPQFREFERFTTTAMNAFIGPLVRDYVNRLAEGLAATGFKGEVHIMRSNGGVAPPRTTTEKRTVRPAARTALPATSPITITTRPSTATKASAKSRHTAVVRLYRCGWNTATTRCQGPAAPAASAARTSVGRCA